MLYVMLINQNETPLAMQRVMYFKEAESLEEN